MSPVEYRHIIRRARRFFLLEAWILFFKLDKGIERTLLPTSRLKGHRVKHYDPD